MEYPYSLRSKLPKVGTTIFTTMSALATKHKAINLSQGFPEFDGGDELRKKVNKYMKAGKNHYAPMGGVLRLKEAIAAKMKSMYSATYDPADEITVTAGATQAIFTTITALIKEGDEVIILSPSYDCYAPAIELQGAKAVYVDLLPGTYGIDWENLKKVMNFKTRMIIINTPHNPTGAVLNAEQMTRLSNFLEGSEILVLSDEVYEHIIFDGQEHQSVARFPELAKRSILCYSFGKTYHNTGWRLGYCIAPANLMAEFRKVHQFNVFTCNTPMQEAFADIVAEDRHLALPSFFQEKRDEFQSLLKGGPFEILPCHGTYFQLLGYKNITEEADVDFAVRLTEQYKVASIPISVFYPNKSDYKVLRFCFAKHSETLQKAAEILKNVKA